MKKSSKSTLTLIMAVFLVISVLYVLLIRKGRQRILADSTSDLRADLRKAFNLPLEISLTKQTCQLGQVIEYKEDPYKSLVITETFYDLLPSTTPFGRQPYKSCSVVGNGGILLRSGCGKEIDAADFVFRSNIPPLKSFEEDVGSKTNFTTINLSILWRHHNLLKTEADSDEFVERIKEQGESFLFVPAFVTKDSEPYVHLLNSILAERRNYLRVRPLYPTNAFFDNMERFWRDQSGYELVERRLTSGLYMVSIALTLCEQVNIYGFYPSHISPSWSYLRHQYYSPYSFVNLHEIGLFGYHDMPQEFSILESLHKRLILRLRLGCQDSGTEELPLAAGG